MNRYDSIQALRAFAAALVVFAHSLDTYALKIAEHTIDYNFGAGFGVKIFFFISGFIIYKSSLSLEPSLKSSINFAIRRVIRIVPIYWIATLIYALKQYYISGVDISFNELLASLLFYPYSDPTGLLRPILGVGWTLNYEMFFYSIFTFAILLSLKFRAVFTITLIFIFLVIFKSTNGVDVSNKFGFDLLATEYLLFFIGGLLIAQLTETSFFKKLYIKDKKIIPAILAIIILNIYLINTIHESNQYYFQLLMCFIILILATLSPINKNHPVTSNKRKWLIMAGDGSYSTYLFHGFIMGVSARIVSALNIYLDPLLFATTMVVICTLAGIVIYKTIELPMLEYLNTKWNMHFKQTKAIK